MRMSMGLVTVLAAMSLGVDAFADGSAEAGAAKAAVCLACHGPNGNSSNPEWPNLAGQHASYTAEQLRFFKEGKRNNLVMAPIVASLSDQDIEDLAAYFETQTPTGLEADPSYWEAGQRLYRGGDPVKNVPACVACHGPLAHGNAPAKYPLLQSQHSVYTQKQLQEYAAGTRPGSNAEIMRMIASRLSAEDMRDLASYIQGIR